MKGGHTAVKRAKAGSAKTETGSGVFRSTRAVKMSKAAAASTLTPRPVTKRANVSSAQAESAVRAYLAHKTI